jgi:SAM-dependent methyltransferase
MDEAGRGRNLLKDSPTGAGDGVMEHPTTDWRKYNRWNRRDERMAELWVHDLVRYLRALSWLGPDCVVLDYGCGYFDVGLAIADRVGRVDGFDVEERTVECARERAGDESRIFGDSDDIPRATYDLIVANSVFQYLGSDEGVLRALQLCRDLLRPDGRGEILLGDLIPRRYSPVKDAFRSLWVASTNGMLSPMIAHLWKASLKSNGLQLHRIDPERLAELADDAGIDCQRLPHNLTPSRRRYSCLLTARQTN